MDNPDYPSRSRRGAVYATEAIVADMTTTTEVVVASSVGIRDGLAVASRCQSLPRWIPDIRVDRRASGLAGPMTADHGFVPTGRAIG